MCTGDIHKKSSALKADTLEELADKMGVNKKTFLETVKAYNEACATGSDMQVYKSKEYLVPINKCPSMPHRAIICMTGPSAEFG